MNRGRLDPTRLYHVVSASSLAKESTQALWVFRGKDIGVIRSQWSAATLTDVNETTASSKLQFSNSTRCPASTPLQGLAETFRANW